MLEYALVFVVLSVLFSIINIIACAMMFLSGELLYARSLSKNGFWFMTHITLVSPKKIYESGWDKTLSKFKFNDLVAWRHVVKSSWTGISPSPTEFKDYDSRTLFEGMLRYCFLFPSSALFALFTVLFPLENPENLVFEKKYKVEYNTDSKENFKDIYK